MSIASKKIPGTNLQIGSQIKIKNQIYVLIDSPQLLKKYTSPKSTLELLVADYSNTMLFLVEGKPAKGLIQFSLNQKQDAVRVHYWMNLSEFKKLREKAKVRRQTEMRSLK